MSVTIYYCRDLGWVGGKCQYMHVTVDNGILFVL